jgi:hypothetical protein
VEGDTRENPKALVNFHQSCLGHLLRRCRLLQRDHPRARFPGRIARILQHALTVRDRRAAGTMSAHGRRCHPRASLQPTAGRARSAWHDSRDARFARHLETELPALFSFLVDPDLDATNWRAEQALRPAIVTRARCAAGAIDRHVAPRRSRSWPAFFEPRSSARSTPWPCSRRCFARRHTSCHRTSIRKRRRSTDAVTNYSSRFRLDRIVRRFSVNDSVREILVRRPLALAAREKLEPYTTL